MEHFEGIDYCDMCEKEVEYHTLGRDADNKIIWLSCGHVLLIRENTVVQTFNYKE